MRSYGRTSKFFRLDGLLLFCIIMGLRSASSTMINSLFSLVIVRVDTQTEHYVVFLLTSQYPHFHSVSSDQLHGNFSLMFVFCWYG